MMIVNEVLLVLLSCFLYIFIGNDDDDDGKRGSTVRGACMCAAGGSATALCRFPRVLLRMI